MAKKTTIRCPYCGMEYLPGEIYIPKEFVGQPKNIIRDADGNVLPGFDGADMDTKETYICDKCGKEFSVDASITFKTEPIADAFDDGFDTASSAK